MQFIDERALPVQGSRLSTPFNKACFVIQTSDEHAPDESLVSLLGARRTIKIKASHAKQQLFLEKTEDDVVVASAQDFLDGLTGSEPVIRDG